VKGAALPPPRFDTVNAAFRAAAAGAGSGLTFVDLSERETSLGWRELHGRARRAAGALRALGVRPRDRVGLVLPTSPAFMDAFFGTLLAGATPAPLGPPTRLGRQAEYHVSTARMLTTIGARLVLTDRRIHGRLGPTLERARPELGCHAADDVLQGESHRELDEDVPADQIGLIQFSSGSTAEPRAVALSHRQLMAQCAALQAVMPPRDEVAQVGVCWLPLHHDMGLIGCLLSAVAYGRARLVLIRPEHFLLRPGLWLRAISRHHAVVSPAPSFAYGLCLERVRDDEMAGADLSGWRYALNGAEAVSMDVVRRFGERFARWGLDPDALMPVYGLAEAALAVTFSAADEPARGIALDPTTAAATGRVVPGSREVASVGRPVPGFEVEIRGERGDVLPERRVGTIFVRGPSVMTGYHDDPEATAQTLRDGWLDTGDLGFVADEELYVSGRAKDVVIIRGANHTSQEFEECVEGIAGVRAGGVVALGYVPAGADGEALLILAERDSGTSPVNDPAVIEQIRAAVLERAGVRPHAIHLVPPATLPRTSSGKLRRAETLRRFLSHALAPAGTDDVDTASPSASRRGHPVSRNETAELPAGGQPRGGPTTNQAVHPVPGAGMDSAPVERPGP
jgi:fatty-acyl-CoA synthase